MFASIKNRFIAVMTAEMPPLPSSSIDYHLQQGGGGGSGGLSLSSQQLRQQQHHMQDKFAYARPPFLQLLTIDELRASADHNVRPIIVPRDIGLLPWSTGYAECVNSGKSEWNEDQGAFCRQVLSDPTHRYPDLPYTYFGIFDGHAGYGAALAASHQFHHILHEKLVDCIDMLLPRDDDNGSDAAHASTKTAAHGFPHPSHLQRRVSKDELIVGALESAFFHMDALIAQDRDRYRDAGGCTACVALFIDGKMYVANAGDSRAVLCQRRPGTKAADAAAAANSSDGDGLNAYPVPYSYDHTPETERTRLLNVAHLKPFLMGQHYAAMEYARRPHAKDLGQRILCRQGTMKGWTYKTLTRTDLRMPVVTGEGKRSRLLGTLGVTRGFGDHDLLAINSGMQIKPFLTPQPDVISCDLTKIVSIPGENNEDADYGILVMATDGLWDVSENETVTRTVFQTLAKYPTEKHRYTMVAQELVAKARGKINDSGHWRLADSKAAATVDDISVIVVPVYQYYKEHMAWEQRCVRESRERAEHERAQSAVEALELEEKEEQSAPLVNGVLAQMDAPATSNEEFKDEVGSGKTDNDVDDDETQRLEAEISRIQLEEKNLEQAVSISMLESTGISAMKDAPQSVAGSEHNAHKSKSPQEQPQHQQRQQQQQQEQKQRNRNDRKDKR